MGGSSIWDEGKTLEGLDKGGYMVKGSRHNMLGQTGECDEVSVLRGTHPDGTGMEDNGANY